MTSEEDAAHCADGPKDQYRVLHHTTFDKVAFGGGTAKLVFCVRWWPPSAHSVEKFELEVKCRLQASDGSLDTVDSWRPLLLWDDSESVGFFKWYPPTLPLVDGFQEVDSKSRCVASHFGQRSGHQAWYLKLSWQCHSRSAVPWGLWASLQLRAGQQVRCPGAGNGCFEVPLRREVEAGGGCALAGLRDEIAQRLAQLRQAEAQQRQPPPLRRTLLPRGEAPRGCEARARDAATQSRVWREELLHRRGRIRICGRIRGLRPEEASAGEQGAVVKLSPTEVALPMLRRSFEFDLVFGPEARTPRIWEEVSPLVDSVFDQPGMHACVMAYGQTGAGKTFTMEGSDGQTGLITHTVEHLFRRPDFLRTGMR